MARPALTQINDQNNRAVRVALATALAAAVSPQALQEFSPCRAVFPRNITEMRIGITDFIKWGGSTKLFDPRR
jgi:hypothetical protein